MLVVGRRSPPSPRALSLRMRGTCWHALRSGDELFHLGPGQPIQAQGCSGLSSVSPCLVQPSPHWGEHCTAEASWHPARGRASLTAPRLSRRPKVLNRLFQAPPSSPPTHPPCHALLTGGSPSPVLCPQWTDASPSAQDSASSSESVPSPTPCTPPLGSQLAPLLSDLCSALCYCHLPESCNPSPTAPLHTQQELNKC